MLATTALVLADCSSTDGAHLGFALASGTTKVCMFAGDADEWQQLMTSSTELGLDYPQVSSPGGAASCPPD